MSLLIASPMSMRFTKAVTVASSLPSDAQRQLTRLKTKTAILSAWKKSRASRLHLLIHHATFKSLLWSFDFQPVEFPRWVGIRIDSGPFVAVVRLVRRSKMGRAI